jgi:hypothetical protein
MEDEFECMWAAHPEIITTASAANARVQENAVTPQPCHKLGLINRRKTLATAEW